MRPTNPRKTLLAHLSLLLCICAGSGAQQAAPAAPAKDASTSNVNDSGTKPAPQNGTSPASGDQSPKSSDNTLKDLDKDPDRPGLPSAQTVVVKDENDIPKRKNLDYEDWSNPELPSDMKMAAVPLLKSEQKTFTRAMISVQWRELDPIDLWVIKPVGVKNPPVILYLYSYAVAHYKDAPSTTLRYKDDQFCEFVTRNGFAAVGFASAVTEQRFHDRPTRDTFVNQLPEALSTTTHDVQMILNYLTKRGDLDMTRVGMWGDGSGASVAIMAAAVDSRIKAIDVLDPWGDWPEWLNKSSLVPEAERADLVNPIFLKTLENLDPVKYLPRLKTQQVRLQQIKAGIKFTPDVVRDKMEAAAPSNAEIVHYENTKAFFTDVASKGTGFDWIKARIGSAVAGQDAGIQRVTKASAESSSPAN